MTRRACLKINLPLLTLLLSLPLSSFAACPGVNQWDGDAGPSGTAAWGDTGNWSQGCIPGTVTLTGVDNATFAQIVAGKPASISLDLPTAINPGLNSLIFNNAGVSFTITTPTTRYVQFNGTTPALQNLAGTHVLNIPLRIDTNKTLAISALAGTSLTLKKSITEVTTGSPGSSISFTGPGEFIFEPTATNTSINLENAFTQSGGTFTNHNLINATTANSSSLFSKTATLSNGTYKNINAGTISGSSFIHGSYGYFTGNFTANNTSILNQNSGSVTSDTGSAGATITSQTDIQITNTNYTANNSAAISGNTAFGTELRAPSMQITGGTVNLTNTATTGVGYVNGDGCVGNLIQPEGPFSIASSVLTLNNSGNILNNSSQGNCIFINTNTTTFTLSDSSVSFLNNALIPSTGVGNFIFCPIDCSMTNSTMIADNQTQISGVTSRGNLLGFDTTHAFVMNNGSISLNNSAAVNALNANGTRMTAGSLTLTNGSITLSNSGNISGGNAAGSALRLATIVMNSGTINVTKNTGTLSGLPTDYGSLLDARTSIAVNGGTLINNDKVQCPLVTIGSGGNVIGSGVFENTAAATTAQITNNGTLTPGVLHINGAYTQGPGGKLVTDLVNTASYSKLLIGGTSLGTAQLNGNLQLAFSSGSNVNPGDSFSILETSNGLRGQFSSITSSNIPSYLRYQVDYLGSSVLVSFIGLLEESFSGTYVSAFPQTIISTVNQTNLQIGRQSFQLRDQISSIQTKKKKVELLVENDPIENISEPAQGKTRKGVSLPQKENRFTFYSGPTGNVGKVFAEGNEPSFNYWSAGGLMGINYAFPETGMGVQVNYDHIQSKTNSAGNFHTDEARLSGYAVYQPKQYPELAINGIVGGSYEWYQINRNVVPDGRANGSPEGSEFDALLGIEYTIDSRKISRMPKSVQITPLAALQYIYLKVNHYQETNGNTFNLSFEQQKIESLRSTLGSRINFLWNSKSKKSPLSINTEIDLAWQREYLNKNRSFNITTETPLAFNVASASVVVPGSGRNVLLAGIDILCEFKHKYGLEGSYNFEWNDDTYLNHNFNLNFNVKF